MADKLGKALENIEEALGSSSTMPAGTEDKLGWHLEHISGLLEESAGKTDAALENKADLVNGKVPAEQLPSFVDDVLEFEDLAHFPEEGETSKIYVALDTNYTYRWGGTTYAQVGGKDNSDKQDVLVSGTNIKTINGNSLLGSGDLTIKEVIILPFTGATSLNGTSLSETALAKVADENCVITWRSVAYRKTSEDTTYLYYTNTVVDSGKAITKTIKITKSSGALSNYTAETDLVGSVSDANDVINIVNQAIDDGDIAVVGEKGEKGDAFTYADFTPEQLESLRGPQGIQGPAGNDGANGSDGISLSIKEAAIDCLAVGDAYIDNQGHLKVLSVLPNTYVDAGQIVGPKGDKGDKGDTGEPGPRGYVGIFVPNAAMVTEVGQAYVDESTGHFYICTSLDPKTFEDAGYFRGPQGERGYTGPQGPAGQNGRDGYVKGFRWNQEDIEEVDEAYVDSNGNVYICTSLDPLEFKAWGNIKGPQGERGYTGPTGPVGPTGYVKKFVSDISYVTATGDAYVGANGHLYVCTSFENFTFDDVGDIRGPQGIQGPRGYQGEKGDRGATGYVTAFRPSAEDVQAVGEAYLEENGDVKVCISLDPKTFEYRGNLKGPKGDIGPRGAKGDLGYVSSFVPNRLSITAVGQAYIDENNHLQVCVAIEPDFAFEDCGDIRGPQGEQGPKGDAFEYEDFTSAQLEALRGPQGIQGIQGIQGPKGDTGEGFSIYRTYASIAAMEADVANVAEGKFVLITSNVDDIDNAKLYVKGASSFTYLTDLSGATGIQGPQGPQGIQGIQGEQGPAGADAVDGIEIVAYQNQTPLTAEQIAKAQEGKLAVYKNGKLYTVSYVSNTIINFSHFTHGHNIGSSVNVNDITSTKEYLINMVIADGILNDTGYMPVDAVGDYANNFLNTDTAPNASGKKLIKEPLLAKAQDMIAPQYDTTATYEVDDLVIYLNELYKCKSAISVAESFTAAHWDKIDLASVINGDSSVSPEDVVGIVNQAIEDGDITMNAGEAEFENEASELEIARLFRTEYNITVLAGPNNEYSDICEVQGASTIWSEEIETLHIRLTSHELGGVSVTGADYEEVPELDALPNSLTIALANATEDVTVVVNVYEQPAA